MFIMKYNWNHIEPLLADHLVQDVLIFIVIVCMDLTFDQIYILIIFIYTIMMQSNLTRD